MNSSPLRIRYLVTVFACITLLSLGLVGCTKQKQTDTSPPENMGTLRLSPATLADIFLGKITNWNDAAIKTDNPDLTLPDQAISVVHRSDGSGTTWMLTDYLSKVSATWKEKVGCNKAVKWPVGLGGKGNLGVANYVQATPGSIGYVEYAYAIQSKMATVQLKNQSGKWVVPTSETFQAAAANADWAKVKNFFTVLTDQPGEKSWPITGATYILVHKEQKDADKARQVLKFFDWAYEHGGKKAEDLHYLPMPNNVIQLVRKMWASEITTDGKAIWPTDQEAKSGLSLNGTGATFPDPVYKAWAGEYNTKTGVMVNYQGIGSSGGLKAIQNKTADFGASDEPQSPEELQKLGAVQFPTVIGGVVLVVNLKSTK